MFAQGPLCKSGPHDWKEREICFESVQCLLCHSAAYSKQIYINLSDLGPQAACLMVCAVNPECDVLEGFFGEIQNNLYRKQISDSQADRK